MSDKIPEGWAWPSNAKKRHYFVEGRSLCGKWAYRPVIDDDNDLIQPSNFMIHSPDTCKKCAQLVAKRNHE